MIDLQQLILDSTQIRDEVIPGANSANRLGSLFLNVAEALPAGGIFNNSLGIDILPKVCDRNDITAITRIDFTSTPSGSRSFSFVVEAFFWFSMDSNPASDLASVYASKRVFLISFNPAGSSFNSFTFQSIDNGPASRTPATNDITSAFIDFSLTADAQFDLFADITTGGIGTSGVIVTGYMSVKYNPYASPPILTLL